ncbi:MAG: putative selenate ABC transporter substrate-binding protein [Myxococcota bacterium]
MQRKFATFLFVLFLVVVGSSCRKQEAAPTAPAKPLVLSAIPDQDPEKLQRLYGSLADYLTKTLGVKVEYKPVTDYKAVVTAFKVGDLDLVWFGGLTGVQARLQVPDAQAILQRDIDEKFRSVFIANAASGIKSLADLKGHTFTFGSESSTSGRLMPQYFLEKAGVQLGDFKGTPGFSGSHDKTIELVTAGSFDAGAVNEQVWKKRLEKGTIDTTKVVAISVTEPYHDYHWVLNPEASKRFGNDFQAKVVAAFKALSVDKPEQAAILDLFGAKSFIDTQNKNYGEIEQVGRSVGLIVGESPISQK